VALASTNARLPGEATTVDATARNVKELEIAISSVPLDAVYQSLDLRTTLEAQPVELTGAAVALALLLLTVGGLLMTHWFGRIL